VGAPKTQLISGILGLALLDQGVKQIFVHRLTLGESLPLWPGVFHFTLAHNTGAAFSLFNQHPGLLLGVTVAIFTGLFWFSVRHAHADRYWLAGFTLVLGGALGNIVDRLRYGYVVDYLDVAFIRYPVFNLADAFIFCGTLLLVLNYLGILTTTGRHDGRSH
jgi:signal peptidase II